MRRRITPLLMLLAFCNAVAPAQAQRHSHTIQPSATQRPLTGSSAPPHAWLFGTWTGGLFPVLEGMVVQDCRTQPTVIFAQDVVAHASLLGSGMSQRLIETVRTSPAGAEMRFSPEADDTGFGCENADSLHVARESESTISFPHCAAFPYPLQRCPLPGR